MDPDIDGRTRDQLVEEGEEPACRHRRQSRQFGSRSVLTALPALGLLPEQINPAVAAPHWPKFLRGCIAYREILGREIQGAMIADVEYDTR
jgi:hypothetical protein